MQYRIKSTVETDEETGEALYWNNQDGWVDKNSADIFTETFDYIPLHSIIEPLPVNMQSPLNFQPLHKTEGY